MSFTSFDDDVYDGASITCEVDGFELTATIHQDEDTTPPWQREDGHGPVSGWTASPKGPGDLVLHQAGRMARRYDFKEACRIALRDGWGPVLEGETPKARAARAARADFETLHTWCADLWTYVGVAVTVTRNGVRLTGRYEHSCWGIESTADDYLVTVANDLLQEALEAAKSKLKELCTCG